MKIAEWTDGYVLEIDPRMADPLYYYMRQGDWEGAIGFKVSPHFQLSRSTSVIIEAIWPHSKLPPTARGKMFERVVTALVLHFPKLSDVTLKDGNLSDLLKVTSLSSIFAAAGFGEGPLLQNCKSHRWVKGPIDPSLSI